MTDPNPYQSPELPRAEPQPIPLAENQPDGPTGLGGWLILVGIGVVLSPIRLGAMFFTVLVPVFTDGTWEALTTPGAENYHPLWGPLLIFEILSNLVFLVGFSVLTILFFRKSKFFPKTYIALAFLTICFIVLDAWACTFVLTDQPMFDPETATELFRSLVAFAIWAPYMMISKRVKNTFVE